MDTNTYRKEVMSDMEVLYTMEEAEQILKFKRLKIYQMIKRGELSAIKAPGRGKGGDWRFRQVDFDKWAKRFSYRVNKGR